MDDEPVGVAGAGGRLEKGGRRRRRPPEILSPQECRRLLQACGRGPAGVRNRALLVVLWRAGLRIGEALELRACDLSTAQLELRVLHGKGDRARSVYLDPMAWGILEAWIARRGEYPRPRSGPLFCTITQGHAGEPLSSSYVRQALARTARRAGIEKAVRPHGLRHTHAVELAREGVPVNLIRRQLGHARLNTTAIYVDHLAPGELEDAIRRRAWPGRAAEPPTP